jgi:hypothetical protein
VNKEKCNSQFKIFIVLDDQPRSDFITVDASLNPPGSTMVDLLAPDRQVLEDRGGRHVVRAALEGHGIMILMCSQ